MNTGSRFFYSIILLCFFNASLAVASNSCRLLFERTTKSPLELQLNYNFLNSAQIKSFFASEPYNLVPVEKISSTTLVDFNKTIKKDMVLTESYAELTQWKNSLNYIRSHFENTSINLNYFQFLHSIATRQSRLSEQDQNYNLAVGKPVEFKFNGKWRTEPQYYYMFHAEINYMIPISELNNLKKNPFLKVSEVSMLSDEMSQSKVHFVSPRFMMTTVRDIFEYGLKSLHQAQNKKQKLEIIFKIYQALMTTHPFVDGNGRSVRLLTYTLLLQNDFPITFFPNSGEFDSHFSDLVSAYVYGNNLQF